ncbi:MAG: hypothetical protein H3Z50_01625 [archaeon]|nr:hypothetical protein [archaeon]MCP8305699.1 hypothetical protein [archaeon]
METYETKRSGFAIASGILTIIASCLSLFIGYWLFPSILWQYGDYGYIIFWLGLLAFGFGLTAGVLALKRRTLVLVMIGMVLVLVIDISLFIIEYLLIEATYYYTSIGLTYGVPAILFIVLGIIFSGISRKEFT